MAITKKPFGTVDGREAVLYVITNANGAKIALTDFGAALVQLWMPDRCGVFDDVVLGYDDAPGYTAPKGHLGAPVGRNANRIANASFVLNGVRYQLAKNNGENNLHSGPDFYEHRFWEGEEGEDGMSVVFRLDSPDGDQGFPGNAKISVTYTLTEDNVVRFTYDGVSDQDTIFNMTNHSYFNLAGQDAGTALDHKIMIPADTYAGADSASIVTDPYVPVDGTVMDLRTPVRIGDGITAPFKPLLDCGGYDQSWNLSSPKEEDGLRLAAVLSEAKTGRVMKVYTDLPAVQFYTGNYVDYPGKGGHHYKPQESVCLETQYVPNAMNLEGVDQPFFKAGEAYHSVTEYRFSVEA